MRFKKIHHNAYFWLNNPKDLGEKEYFLACLKKFIDLSSYANQTIVSQPSKTNKAVVDCSHTFCLMITFKNKEEHDLYKEEEAHKEFVKEVGHLWKKVQVFNSEEIWNTVSVEETV